MFCEGFGGGGGGVAISKPDTPRPLILRAQVLNPETPQSSTQTLNSRP